MTRISKILFFSTYLLVGFGLVMTYSSSAVYARQIYGTSEFFLIRQFLFMLGGTAALFLAYKIPINFWQRNARKVILAAIGLVLLTFIPVLGHSAGGARRWINLGISNFQPAEFAKLAVCIYLSDYLTRKIKKVQQGGLTVFLAPLGLIGLLCGLILIQPDLGSCAFILLMTAILVFLAGMELRYVMIASTVFLPVFYFLVIKEPYRLSRVTAYLNPWQDPQGSGFQMIQSLIAFGLGGFQGAGLGKSTQKLFYLPSAHNDFIFAILGEELGFVGCFAVIVLFFLIFFAGFRIAARTQNLFCKFLAMAITAFIVLQAILNILVATGLLPTKGLPMPFISYGGTSMLINLMAVGILLGIENGHYSPSEPV